MQKAIRLGNLLHLRSRIGDRHEVAADFRSANRLLGAFEEILLENVWFECAARLAGHNKKRLLDIDLVFEAFNLRRIGRIENVQCREVRDAAKRHAQHFGTKAGAAHAEEQDMLETALLHFFRNLLQLILLPNLLFDNIEPAQPTGFIRARPQRRIVLPEAL